MAKTLDHLAVNTRVKSTLERQLSEKQISKLQAEKLVLCWNLWRIAYTPRVESIGKNGKTCWAKIAT